MHRCLCGVQRGTIRLKVPYRRYYAPPPPMHIKGSKEPIESKTIVEIKEKMMQRLGLEPGYNLQPKSREHLLQYQPKAEELPPRAMQDSFSSAIIPLSTDRLMQDKYMNFYGHVRMGRLMEDMDLFAAWCCHGHLSVPTLPEGVHLPYTFVTILVDNIDFAANHTLGTHDIRLSGHVSWVGSSSMEVVVWLEQVIDGEINPVTHALFLMGARNATNTAAAAVNPIEPSNEKEKVILAGGAERKRRRQEWVSSTEQFQPTVEEIAIMSELHRTTSARDTLELNKRNLPENCRWMKDSFQTNTTPSFPEHRNHHNRVFGGYLMRTALEISWVAVFLYSKSRPYLKQISDIVFQKPVPVDSLIKTTAYVVYTWRNYLQIRTVCDVIDKNTGDQVTTNTFNFTFAVSEDIVVPQVLPLSFHETIWYTHGRRRFESTEAFKEQSKDCH
ncbi:acyl-coenzyme A thioesterase 9, mitochondrial-like isoform X2 [Drosophila serrata]|uniref:acyl-coenzyme A thioesterase 9, mitochondrial-like isoform X2 n=1 Tax=Drosophila serrata TaxID=7274 RepID=UPI000A1CFD04|nr:acyl-coenzyme A thioesterase 9, mitochondrial-like isoform X2 [Drosophila serrata]